MIQLELYIREIIRFLRTMTIKNEYFKDQMEETYAADAFKGKYPDHLHPYYRHLLGKASYESFDNFRSIAGIKPYDETNKKTKSDADLAVEYGFDYVETAINEPVIEYETINGIEVKLRSYIVTRINEKNGKEELIRVYPNCVWYYGQICPVRILYKKFDELITINSIDTKKIIPFNSHTLKSKDHQKTALLYRMPSRYYSKLCSKYAKSVDLIKAIVYPVPSQEACFDASNYSLISCDLTQLRENERSTMYNCVLDTLSMIKTRWDVPDFVYEDLYALSIQAKIWDTLLLALMKQRIKNIRTSATHEYHIWEYLKSHGLDDYSDVLSLKQTIFLYRNFPYLLRNRGTDFNLILLAHKLLSEWNIVIYGKNILQTTDGFAETCKTDPYVDSIVVGKTVLDDLKRIDNNDIHYLNKTIKSSDELNSFDYRLSDLQQNQAGTLETLPITYRKEQEAELEYSNEFLYEASTNQQTKLFTNTPHTSMVTKLLEISKDTTSTLFKQIYARFMTESLLYRASIGQTDYIVSFIPDGMDYSVNLSIKDAIGLVWFCTLKELGIYDGDRHHYPYFYLTVPYKESFNPIPETFKWNNEEQRTTNILRYVPTVLYVESDELPSMCVGRYEIIDSSVYYDKWVWENNQGVTISFYVNEVFRQWKMSIPSESDNIESQENTIVLYADYRMPYQGWKYQELVWKSEHESFTSTVVLNSYDYLIERLMPNYSTDTYQDLINLLHEQALGYIRIYRELHGSDWSRQHSGVVDIIKERTVNQVVRLDIFEEKVSTEEEQLNDENNNHKYLTFEEYINSNADIKEVIDSIEGNTPLVIRTEYAKLGNSIVKALFPLNTDYLEDNSGVVVNRFNRLKELFINLCSYNVAYLEGSVNFSDTTLVLNNFITQDYDYGAAGFNSKYFINTASMTHAYHHGFVEYFEPIKTIASIINDQLSTPFYIGDTFCRNCIEYKDQFVYDPEFCGPYNRTDGEYVGYTESDKPYAHSIGRNTNEDDFEHIPIPNDPKTSVFTEVCANTKTTHRSTANYQIETCVHIDADINLFEYKVTSDRIAKENEKYYKLVLFRIPISKEDDTIEYYEYYDYCEKYIPVGDQLDPDDIYYTKQPHSIHLK